MNPNSMRFLLLLLAFTIQFSATIQGQTQSSSNLAELLSNANKQRILYIEEFRNLQAEEIKISETFDKSGEVKRKRVITSTFVVYQLAKESGTIAEYRNVLSIDGKRIENAEKRNIKFFEEIVRSDSSQKELDRLAKEGSRLDQGFSLNGLTLFPAGPLAEHMRPFFRFEIESASELNGREVFVVSYRQEKESPYVITAPKKKIQTKLHTLVFDLDLDSDERARLSGTFWIDRETFQVRKEHRFLSVDDGDASGKVILEQIFEYGDSKFGILTPKSITTFFQKSNGKAVRKEASLRYEYGPFVKPNVEVRMVEEN